MTIISSVLFIICGMIAVASKYYHSLRSGYIYTGKDVVSAFGYFFIVLGLLYLSQTLTKKVLEVLSKRRKRPLENKDFLFQERKDNTTQSFKPSLKRILLGFLVLLIALFLFSWIEGESGIFMFISTASLLAFISSFFIQFVRLEQDYLIVESILSIALGHLFPNRIKLSDIVELRYNVVSYLVLGFCIDIKAHDKRIQISNLYLEQKTYNSLIETLSSKVSKNCLIVNHLKPKG